MNVRKNKWLDRFVASVLHKKVTEAYEAPNVNVPSSWKEIANGLYRIKVANTITKITTTFVVKP